jgi:hypothetical protein
MSVFGSIIAGGISSGSFLKFKETLSFRQAWCERGDSNPHGYPAGS